VLTRILDTLLGPRCPYGCGHRGRGSRSLTWHINRDHAGDPAPDRSGS
jgi:hypothetical protein